uniref:EsaB/YukD family protein n=1 Tax=Corynebacterium macginleyi TaxID=38290 RepID=UPI001F22C745|nr:EsaB/YukD family protein [Corynebacterium macginleyi]
MTAPTAHHLRLTIRIHADCFHKETDVALPLSSSLGELMAELTDLVDAPEIASPWRASTASGRAIDLTAPLAATPLTEGSILLLAPREERPAPVIRDAAESLAAQSQDDTTSAIPIVWGWTGLAAAFAVAWVLSPPAVAGAGLAVAAFVLALWTRALSLVMLTLAAGAASGWALISPALADAPLCRRHRQLHPALSFIGLPPHPAQHRTDHLWCAHHRRVIGQCGHKLPASRTQWQFRHRYKSRNRSGRGHDYRGSYPISKCTLVDHRRCGAQGAAIAHRRPRPRCFR